MIQPPRMAGVGFSEATDGDIRNDLEARARLSKTLGIPEHWATVVQVHGNGVIRADRPGSLGEADAIWTTQKGLPVGVFTADCFGVLLTADSAVGVAHAGWRGASAGVVARLRDEMESAGHQISGAAIGPGIGPCCFEVGQEVLTRFPSDTATTTWGTPSVDLRRAVESELPAVEVWTSPNCTHHDEGWFSHRRDGSSRRLAAVGWLP
jgi:YfiH family protein